MLEFSEDKKKVKLWYQFNSKLVDDDGYEKYDYDNFCYKIDIDEVKETICYKLSQVIEKEHTSLTILDALNELDGWECIDWNKIIEKCEDLLMEYYDIDAMEYFVENHEEFTKDDYDDMEYDRRRCEE